MQGMRGVLSVEPPFELSLSCPPDAHEQSLLFPQLCCFRPEATWHQMMSCGMLLKKSKVERRI